MKYHINRKKEVKACSAKQSQGCPFWGINDSRTNHYNDIETAQAKAEELLTKKHNMFNSPQRNLTPQFNITRDNVQKNLLEYAGIKASNEENVKNVKEIISTWFNGDRNKYETFNTTVENNDLNKDTKKSVVSMLMSGVTVHNKSSVQDIPLEQNTKYDFSQLSEVTILDELPDKLDLNALRSGKLKAFKSN